MAADSDKSSILFPQQSKLNKLLGTDTPISGLKGYMGHTLGAAGAIESIASIMDQAGHPA